MKSPAMRIAFPCRGLATKTLATWFGKAAPLIDQASILPLFLALTAAAIWGFNSYIQRMALDHTDARTGALLSVAGLAGMFWIFAPFVIDWAWFTDPAIFIFLGIGLLFPAAGQWLHIAALPKVGPAITSALGAFTPLFSVGIGMVLLAEVVTLQSGFGLTLMILALMLAAWSPKGLVRSFPLWALALPLGASMARGIAQPVTKFGLGVIASPYFAVMIAGSVSTLVLLILWKTYPGDRRINARGVRWFLLSGVLNGLGILVLNQAMMTGSLTLVSPVAATTPLFALLFGAVLFRLERLTWRHLWIGLLSVAGGILILLG